MGNLYCATENLQQMAFLNSVAASSIHKRFDIYHLNHLPADDSHEIPSLIYPTKKNKKDVTKCVICCSHDP